MFSKTKLKSGGTLQEVMRSGKHAYYDYTPEGSRKATHRVKARHEWSAENKLTMTGIIEPSRMIDDETDDVKPLTADAKKPVSPYAKVFKVK